MNVSRYQGFRLQKVSPGQRLSFIYFFYLNNNASATQSPAQTSTIEMIYCHSCLLQKTNRHPSTNQNRPLAHELLAPRCYRATLIFTCVTLQLTNRD